MKQSTLSSPVLMNTKQFIYYNKAPSLSSAALKAVGPGSVASESAASLVVESCPD